jgi:hypothetical protein
LYEGSDELVLRKENDSQNLPPREYMAILCDKTRLQIYKYEGDGNLYKSNNFFSNVSPVYRPVYAHKVVEIYWAFDMIHFFFSVLIDLALEVIYGMILFGYVQSLSAYDPSKSHYRMPSASTFRNAKDLVVSAESKTAQAVHFRLNGNASEAENYT